MLAVGIMLAKSMSQGVTVLSSLGFLFIEPLLCAAMTVLSIGDTRMTQTWFLPKESSKR